MRKRLLVQSRVSSGNQHPHLLKSRYRKVSPFLSQATRMTRNQILLFAETPAERQDILQMTDEQIRAMYRKYFIDPLPPSGEMTPGQSMTRPSTGGGE